MFHFILQFLILSILLPQSTIQYNTTSATPISIFYPNTINLFSTSIHYTLLNDNTMLSPLHLFASAKLQFQYQYQSLLFPLLFTQRLDVNNINNNDEDEDDTSTNVTPFGDVSIKIPNVQLSSDGKIVGGISEDDEDSPLLNSIKVTQQSNTIGNDKNYYNEVGNCMCKIPTSVLVWNCKTTYEIKTTNGYKG